MSVTGSRDIGEFFATEHPSLAPALDGIGRRSLLKAMAASLALAGLSGCDWRPDDDALPYVNTPENVAPGRPKWYATAATLNGYALPALGKTYAGRPVKLEGNSDHPASGGASDHFLQAALLGLYDPGRSQAPLHLGRAASWDVFDAAMAARTAALDGRGGEGFRLLTGTVTSPTLARQIDLLLRRWPMARWHVFEPAGDGLRLEATRLVFGRPLERQLNLDRAEVIVSLDDDFLGPGPHQTIHARGWSKRRAAYQRGDGASRLLVAEPTPSITGARADRRLIASAPQMAELLHAIAVSLGAVGGTLGTLPEVAGRWVRDCADALVRHPGRSVLLVGPWYSPEVQALGILINEKIGAFQATLDFTDPIAVAPSDGANSFSALVGNMEDGHVDTLVMIDTNPAYATPMGADFAESLQKVPFRIHAGLYHDETGSLSDWHLPIQHDLESWSDARAVDGTFSIIQPLVRPFYSVRSVHTILAGLAGEQGADRDLVRATWQAQWGKDFEAKWADALYRGFAKDSAATPVLPAIVNRDIEISTQPPSNTLSAIIRPDPTVWDGRYANIAWLQELPKPLSKVTWTNVIAVSPALAEQRNLKNGDRVKVTVEGRAIAGAAWIVPGQEPQTISLTLGYGRGAETGLGAGLGYRAAMLQTSDHPWHLASATLETLGETMAVPTTQVDHAMDGFAFVRVVESAQTKEPKPEQESFYPERKWDSPSWGMSIDLDLCIGCSACVVACMAENNVPVVGAELVAEGRAMHWLRVDHYTEGDVADPKAYFQPVPCMHCEQAPCEMGCPVNATVHSSDGLNLQVYNRCIGTRTCSAYCPYKVRRFNWFDFTANDPESIQAMRNPDVTVRQRGVMEKCTYCVQRIREVRITADKDNRAVRDGEVVTACQQACPTQAIVFGNIVDPASAVATRKADGRDYALLEEANTKPRTTYLARIEEDAG
jgi:molybdopterin-containing oxidoreductase family iron-sulfur binding subunit